MSTPAIAQSETTSGTDPLARHLSEGAKHELEGLRAAVDLRLATLEAALVNPDRCDSLETLVIDLARAATAEAELATTRVCLDAQLQAQEQVAAARAKALESQEAERTAGAAVRQALEQARAALDLERKASVLLRHELDEVQSALAGEQAASLARHHQLQETEAALEVEQKASTTLRTEHQEALAVLATERDTTSALRRKVEDLGREAEDVRRRSEDLGAALNAERATSTSLRQKIEENDKQLLALEHARKADRHSFEEQLAAERAREDQARAQSQDAHARLQGELEALRNAATTGVADLEAAQSRVQVLEGERSEIERTWSELRGRADAAIRDRETLALELDAARQAAITAQAEAHALFQAIDAERASTERAWREVEVRLEASTRDRDAAIAELQTVRENARALEGDAHTRFDQVRQTAERRIQELEHELVKRDRERQQLERNAEQHTRLLHERDRELAARNVVVEERDRALAARNVVVEERDRELAERNAVLEKRDRELAERSQILEARIRQVQELDEELRRSETKVAALISAADRVQPTPLGDAVDRAIDAEARDDHQSTDAREVEAPTASPSQETARPPDPASRPASRHVFQSEVQIQIDGGAAWLVDLSLSGAQVLSPTTLKPNRVVKITLPLDGTPISCKGRIVWAQLEPPSETGLFSYRAGVLFTSVDEGAIETFLAHHASSSSGETA